jgi:hypothetical protein
MKKYLLYIILLALAMLTYFLFTKKSTTYEDAKITIEDVSKIEKIFLADVQGNTITAVKQGNLWRVNNSFEASTTAIENIFDVLQHAEAKQPVPQSMNNTVIKNLSVNGIKVEIYGSNNKKIETFTVSGSLQEKVGNVFYKTGASGPFIYKIGQFDSDLSKNFFTSIKDWRSKKTFNIPTDSIKSITVCYNLYPDTSFTITKTGIDFELKDLKNNLIPHTRSKAIDYFKGINKLYCLGFLNDIIEVPTVRKSKVPYGYIATTTISGARDTMHLAFYDVNERTRVVRTENGKQYDADYFYGCKNNDVMLIPVGMFKSVLVHKGSF